MTTTPSGMLESAESPANSCWMSDQWEVRTAETSYVLDVRALKEVLSVDEDTALQTLYHSANAAHRDGRGKDAQALQAQFNQTLLGHAKEHPEIVAKVLAIVAELSPFDIALSNMRRWWSDEEWTVKGSGKSLMVNVQAVKDALSDGEETALQVMFVDAEVNRLQGSHYESVLGDKLQQRLVTLAETYPAVSADLAAASQTTMGV